MSKQPTMTAAEYRLTGGKTQDESASAVTRRLFLFHIRARRLPTPRSKDHPEGELVFMAGEVVARHTKAKKLKTRGRAPEWKFDFAWPEQQIAVEVEGINVVRAGKLFLIGGRHGTVDGFKEDCEKYAWATVNGWRLLRFTQDQVKAGLAIDMLVRLFTAVNLNASAAAMDLLRHDPLIFDGPSIRDRVGDTPMPPLDERSGVLTDELQFGMPEVGR